MKSSRWLISSLVIAAVSGVPTFAQAQISILAGGYVPGSDVHSVTSGAQTVAQQRKGTLSLGANLDLGLFRVSGAYASGTTIQNANRQDIGKGNVLGVAGDIVVRPLPRLLVQPYVLAGAGQKYVKYDQSSSFNAGTTSHDFAWHGGIGADLQLGGLGLVAELTDFVSKNVATSKWNVHDAFLMVGLKLGM